MMGTFHLIETARPHLEAAKGAIVTISSVTGRDVDFSAPSPLRSNQEAAQRHHMAQPRTLHGAKGCSREYRVTREYVLQKTGIWDLVEKGNPELFKAQLALNPTGRLGTPEEVADAVVFLSSQRARP